MRTRVYGHQNIFSYALLDHNNANRTYIISWNVKNSLLNITIFRQRTCTHLHDVDIILVLVSNNQMAARVLSPTGFARFAPQAVQSSAPRRNSVTRRTRRTRHTRLRTPRTRHTRRRRPPRTRRRRTRRRRTRRRRTRRRRTRRRRTRRRRSGSRRRTRRRSPWWSCYTVSRCRGRPPAASRTWKQHGL